MFWAARALHRCTQRDYDLAWEGWVNFSSHRDGDRLWQKVIFNEEFLVRASPQLVLSTSLPFVHTARRSNRLSDPVKNSDSDNDRLPNVAADRLVNLITKRKEKS